MSITKSLESVVFDVEVNDKNYMVRFDTDLNLGYTSTLVLLDGMEVPTGECSSIVNFVLANI